MFRLSIDRMFARRFAKTNPSIATHIGRYPKVAARLAGQAERCNGVSWNGIEASEQQNLRRSEGEKPVGELKFMPIYGTKRICRIVYS